MNVPDDYLPGIAKFLVHRERLLTTNQWWVTLPFVQKYHCSQGIARHTCLPINHTINQVALYGKYHQYNGWASP